jgi:hypothetical protein
MVPVSDPVDHLYATPMDMLEVVPPTSRNSVQPADHPEKTAPAAALDWYTTQIAIRRSPAFFVNPERFGKVRMPVVSAWLAVRTRPPATVGMVGKAT